MSVVREDNLKLLVLDWDGTVVSTSMQIGIALVPRVFPGVVCSPITYKNGDLPQEQLGIMFNPAYSAAIMQNALGKWLEGHPLKKAVETKNLINSAVAKGIKVAIGTFNGYPDAIYEVLKHIGISEDVLGNVVVVCGGCDEVVYSNFSQYQGLKSKVSHIELARQYFGIECGKKEILLVDDSIDNISSAASDGYSVILANPGNQEQWISTAQLLIDSSASIDGDPFVARSANDVWAMNMQCAADWHKDHVIIEKPAASGALPTLDLSRNTLLLRRKSKEDAEAAKKVAEASAAEEAEGALPAAADPTVAADDTMPFIGDSVAEPMEV